MIQRVSRKNKYLFNLYYSCYMHIFAKIIAIMGILLTLVVLYFLIFVGMNGNTHMVFPIFVSFIAH